METIKAAIVCEDMEFSRALAWAMVRNSESMEVWILRDHNEIRSCAVSPDIVIKDMDGECSYDDALTVFLAERRSDEDIGSAILYKYKNVRVMINDIYGILAEKGILSAAADTESKKDLYCFISERGGCGCSSACDAFAGELCKARGLKVLKISLEQFSDHEDEGAGTMKKYLYHLLKDQNADRKCEETDSDKRQGNSPRSGIPLRAFLIRREDGVERFRQPAGQNPLLELDENSFMHFIDNIISDSEHDAIVIDCGCQITMQMIKLMQISKRIFFVKDDRPERTGWRNCMGTVTGDRVIEKIIPVVSTGDLAVRSAARLAEEYA